MGDIMYISDLPHIAGSNVKWTIVKNKTLDHSSLVEEATSGAPYFLRLEVDAEIYEGYLFSLHDRDIVDEAVQISNMRFDILRKAEIGDRIEIRSRPF